MPAMPIDHMSNPAGQRASAHCWVCGGVQRLVLDGDRFRHRGACTGPDTDMADLALQLAAAVKGDR